MPVEQLAPVLLPAAKTKTASAHASRMLYGCDWLQETNHRAAMGQGHKTDSQLDGLALDCMLRQETEL